MRSMKILEVWRVNSLVNHTLSEMKEISFGEVFRIKLENNPIMFLLRKMVGEKIMVNDEVTGTIAYNRNLMGNLFVSPFEQGKGIGTKLLEECEAEVKKKYKNVKIYSYKKAVPLHKKRDYYIKNEKSLLMVKDL